MASSFEPTFSQRNLFQQGYQAYTPRELSQLDWGLRFTPAVCLVMTAIGLGLNLPFLLFAAAILGIWAFTFPSSHPMDFIYNHGVRRLFGAIALPPNPLQRRLACLAAALMNSAAGLCMVAGQMTAAWVVGSVLVAMQVVVITTHFCTLSLIYEAVLRVLGRFKRPVALDEARRLLADGARLVDVRDPEEFEEGHVEGALNIPLDEVDQHLDQIRSNAALVYCLGGVRSRIAATRLKKLGVQDVYDLGGIARARNVETAAHEGTDRQQAVAPNA